MRRDEVGLHGRHTFPKQERLQRGADFRRAYEQGRKAVGRLAVVYVCDVPGRKVGVVTSRKIGGAVERNRARRLLREAYRRNKEKLKENFQLVIVARTAIRAKRFEEVEAAMLRLFAEAGLLIHS